jgi:hypothetical protein
VRVTVEFENADRSRGTMTRTPSWIARLFGRLPSASRIHCREWPLGWLYDSDQASIGDELNKIVNEQRRWLEVRGVPPARVVTAPQLPRRSDR